MMLQDIEQHFCGSVRRSGSLCARGSSNSSQSFVELFSKWQEVQDPHHFS
jgi:hypothetical protein